MKNNINVTLIHYPWLQPIIILLVLLAFNSCFILQTQSEFITMSIPIESERVYISRPYDSCAVYTKAPLPSYLFDRNPTTIPMFALKPLGLRLPLDYRIYNEHVDFLTQYHQYITSVAFAKECTTQVKTEALSVLKTTLTLYKALEDLGGQTKISQDQLKQISEMHSLCYSSELTSFVYLIQDALNANKLYPKEAISHAFDTSCAYIYTEEHYNIILKQLRDMYDQSHNPFLVRIREKYHYNLSYLHDNKLNLPTNLYKEYYLHQLYDKLRAPYCTNNSNLLYQPLNPFFDCRKPNSCFYFHKLDLPFGYRILHPIIPYLDFSFKLPEYVKNNTFVLYPGIDQIHYPFRTQNALREIVNSIPFNNTHDYVKFSIWNMFVNFKEFNIGMGENFDIGHSLQVYRCLSTNYPEVYEHDYYHIVYPQIKDLTLCTKNAFMIHFEICYKFQCPFIISDFHLESKEAYCKLYYKFYKSALEDIRYAATN